MCLSCALLIVILFISPLSSFSQTESTSTYTGSATFAASGLSGIRANPASNEVTVDGMPNNGNAKLQYAEINGSPFLDDAFKIADIYSKENKLLGTYPVRFNMASQQFHFLQDSTEYEIPENIVGKIILKNTDAPAKTLSTYSNMIENISINGMKIDKFVEVLVEGYISFYKYTYKHVIYKESSLNPKPFYYFTISTNYFIGKANDVRFIKKLNAENILELIPQSSKIKDN